MMLKNRRKVIIFMIAYAYHNVCNVMYITVSAPAPAETKHAQNNMISRDLMISTNKRLILHGYKVALS